MLQHTHDVVRCRRYLKRTPAPLPATRRQYVPGLYTHLVSGKKSITCAGCGPVSDGFTSAVVCIWTISKHKSTLLSPVPSGVYDISWIALFHLVQSRQVHNADTDKTRLFFLVLPCLVRVSGVNKTGDKSRLSATENFENVSKCGEDYTENSLDLSPTLFKLPTRQEICVIQDVISSNLGII